METGAEVCKAASLADLDPAAIALFREGVVRKSGNPDLARLSDAHLLGDTDLLVDGEVTFAALILLGTRAALTRHLAQAEVIFEYRATEASVESQRRVEYRQGFLAFQDELWAQIGNWNDLGHPDLQRAGGSRGGPQRGLPSRLSARSSSASSPSA